MNEYKGFLIRQRANSAITFVVLVADAKDVHRWSQTDDIRIDRGNVQRELVESRWKQVGKFFNASPRNVIPTSITIAFSSDAIRVAQEKDLVEGIPNYFLSELNDGVVRLVFPDAMKQQSYVLDGQHRLKGMAGLDGPVIVPVCLFYSLSPLERAFQFVVINNKSHKVPTNNLKALIHNFDEIEEGLRSRLAHASITSPRFATHVDILNETTDSPFHKAIDWVNNRHEDAKKIIQPTAIENGLKAITRGFPETKDDEADSILVMSSIWNAIFESYGITFENIDTVPNLTSKATIQTVTEMIVERLVKNLDPAFSSGSVTKNNAAEAAATAKDLVTDLPIEFWKEAWGLKSLDTAAGREIIAQSIRKLKSTIHADPDGDVDWRIGNPLFPKVDATDE